MIPKDKVLLTI